MDQRIKNKMIYNVPYCPQYNPIEYVNNELKRQIKEKHISNEDDLRLFLDSFVKENNKKGFSKSRYVTIIYGDWSHGEKMKNQMSTPNLGQKRKLRKYFKVYDINEYRTSCLNYKTHEKCENMHLPNKKGIIW